MSGRSAYVRKKITEPNKGAANQNPALRGRANSVGSSRSSRPENGLDYSQSNTHSLKFSELHRDGEHANYHHDAPLGYSSGSQSSENGRFDGAIPRQQGPMPDYAYARVRKPVLRTEDVSGIERSGFRSNMDKRSEEVRKGLSKALFSLGGGKKKNAKKNEDGQLPSSPTPVPGHRGDVLDEYESMSVQMPPPSIAELQGPPTPTFSPPQTQPWDQYGRLQQSQPAMPPPTTKLPPVPQTPGTQPIKRWVGGGRPVQRWNKLRKDPELWDPNGDVLIYLGHRGQNPRPNPSFRLSSHIIEATESRYLVALLREGSTEEDDIHGYLPPSPIGAPPMVLPPRHKPYSNHGYLRPNNDGGISGQPTPPVSDTASSHPGGGGGGSGSGGTDLDGQISYEMYFPTPKNISKTESHRHAITTRNLFALLHHASLVGLSLFQALTDLHARLDEYMPPEADNVGTLLNYLSARGIDDPRNDPETAVSILAWSETPEVRWEEGWREAFLHCAGMMTMHGFSSAPSPSHASPSSTTPSLENSAADYRHLTPITRALLERACLETQLRVQSAEDRLATFDFSDIWPRSNSSSSSSSSSSSPHRQAADRLQRFLRTHYAKMYGGSWPPPPPPPPPPQQQQQQSSSSAECGISSTFWLTRPLAHQLQSDFGLLYDHLVNRSVIWDEDENRSGRKWIMVTSSSSSSSSSSSQPLHDESSPLPLTDLLIEFDNRHRYPHIPHPYPLVPECPSAIDGNGGGGNSKAAADLFERRVRLAYTEATNIYLLGEEEEEYNDDYEGQEQDYYAPQKKDNNNNNKKRATELVDAFTRFERSDPFSTSGSTADPAAARLARWTVIYACLQVLAQVSVDCPGVRYKDDDFSSSSSSSSSSVVVGYHLSASLGKSPGNMRMPPWKSARNGGDNEYWEARHEGSYCWVVPWGRRRRRRQQQQQKGNDNDTAAGRRGRIGGGGGGGGGGGAHSNEGEEEGEQGGAVMRMLRAQADQFPRPPTIQQQQQPTPGRGGVRNRVMNGGRADLRMNSSHGVALGAGVQQQQQHEHQIPPMPILLPPTIPPMSPARAGTGGIRDSAYCGSNRDSLASSSRYGGEGVGERGEYAAAQVRSHSQGRSGQRRQQQQQQHRTAVAAPAPLPLKGITGTGMFYDHHHHDHHRRNGNEDISEEEGGGGGGGHGDDDDDGLDIVINDFDDLGVTGTAR